MGGKKQVNSPGCVSRQQYTWCLWLYMYEVGRVNLVGNYMGSGCSSG